MFYYDDILNVNAYLRQKMKHNIIDTQRLIDDFQIIEKSFDKMISDTDNLIDKMTRLANTKGIDVSDILSKRNEILQQSNIENCCELLVRISKDYDFSKAFEQLCKEAHEAGFTDVHPEDLLSADEMKQAEDFNKALDEKFKSENGLTSKDIFILLIAIAIRVVCYYIYMMKNRKEIISTSGKQGDNEYYQDGVPTPSIDTNNGVDMKEVLKSTLEFSNTINKSDQLINKIMGKESKIAKIRNVNEILTGSIPFDLPDNKLFSRSEILGFHPQLGWLFGVINILTDTVTTSKIDSYSVYHTFDSQNKLQIGQKLSTLYHVVNPVIQNVINNKESLLAAVVREAYVQNVIKVSVRDTTHLLTKVMEVEQRNQSLLDKVQGFSNVIPLDWDGIIRDTVFASFVNNLIAAVHAIQYDPSKDGSVDMYAVRTSKILMISNGVSALINSMPGIISMNLTKLDFAGLITTCLSAFNSTKFWIEVKTNYLVSEYKKELDKQLAIIDKYFIYE
ncbi:MAG TPA: hypothetical protein PLK32_08830 [Defluviitoga tunisiensis]|nr:hypothetical protein [Defluviitoga tunisiensis]